MKMKFAIILVVIIACHSAFSQKAFPSFEDHPEWNVQRSVEPSMPGPISIMSYHLEKDTVINQKTYSPVSRIWLDELKKSYQQIGFVRTVSKKVFFKESAQGKEYLLYDFGLKKGDKAYCAFRETDSAKYEVLKVDSITLSGVKRLRMKVFPEDYGEGWSIYWIEGLGSLLNPFYYEIYGIGGAMDEVRCISVDAGLLYKNPNYDDCTTASKKTNFIVNEGVIWSGMNIYKDVSGKDSVASYHIRMNGDTVLNDRTYTKVWQSNDSLAEYWQIRGLIREENKKVWFHFLGDDGYVDHLLYDFSLGKGSTQLMSSVNKPWFYETYKVTEVDSVLINGVKRLRIQLENMSNRKITWIEKIGSLKGILNSFYVDGDENKQLLCVTENNNQIYSNELYPKCYYTENSLLGSAESFPSMKDKPVWRVLRYAAVNPPQSFLVDYQLEKDTILNNIVYSIVSYSYDDGYFYREGFTRTSSNKVYYKKTANSKEQLMYDFALNAGDSVYCAYCGEDSMKCHVLSVDSINVNGYRRKRLKVLPEDYWSMYWIEGIGCDISPFYPMRYGCEDGSSKLRCTTLNSTLVYMDPKATDCSTITGIEQKPTGNKFRIYPNPVENVLFIENNSGSSEDLQITIFDQIGRIVCTHTVSKFKNEIDVSSLPRGQYFIQIKTDNSIETKEFIKQ